MPSSEPQGNLYFSERAATPGRVLPSRSSKLAPPPVETCDSLSSAPYLAQTVAPLLADSIAASRVALEPPAKLSNSKTPAGPFQRMVLLSMMVFLKSSRDFGPASRPIQPSGMPSASDALPTWAFLSNLSAVM